ncbi:S8 family serine peptidase [Micromonospora sp. WMMD1082]|uniref:S8 family serine peptidase n=1 Tax=Micromonospora sp. WMMD1082 TaxID=3016104 RepID=UPI002415AA04|nr:S8 family serine peptidase [Micromonospora sp. WMMD1082]MDG4798312.1 S8 family serine peptidase [Micromonospora sp. WMMD1082]
MISTSMRRGVAATTVVLLAAGLLPPGPAAAVPAAGVDRTVIVEFDVAPTIAVAPAPGTVDAQAADRLRRARATVAAAEQEVTDAARRARIQVERRRSFEVLLPGMTVRVPAGQVDTLRRLPGVKAVHEVTRFQIREAVAGPGSTGGAGPGRPAGPVVEENLALIGAPQAWRRTDGAGRPLRGGGVTVAVIDTGVDYTHPSLGGGFGPGRKVVGGYDFVNDDADPMDDHSHGTHVAGIIAGTGASGVTGVAPDATLTAYKVLDADGWGESDGIVAALEAAVDPANPHRADLINMSLGGTGDGTDPVGRAASAAVAAGVTVVAAAGNSGPGERTVGSPALADGVLAVGASTSGVRVPVAELTSPRKGPIVAYRSAVSANPPVRTSTGDLVDVGEGTPAEWAAAGDVRGKVVLISGAPYAGASPDDVDRFTEAERRGALAAVGYTRSLVGDETGADGPAGGFAATVTKSPDPRDELRFNRLVVLGIDDPGQYAELRQLLDAGRVRVAISGQDATDQIARFSSRGPDLRWGLKPQLVAPGVEIRSAVPTALWAPGVQRYSGTSMAAPHVAGAGALLRQLRPEVSPAGMTGALVGSATKVDAGPASAGAGRLDLPAALDAEVTADPPALSLGLADLTGDRVRTTGTVTLRNDGRTSTTVRLRVTPAAGSPGVVRVTPERVTVPAGRSAAVTVRIEAPAPDQGHPDVSGWLTAAGGKGTDLRVPYLLAVRTPWVYATPDPSDGRSAVYVDTLDPVETAPAIVVTGPDGRRTEVTPIADGGVWWHAPVTGDRPGTYAVTASVRTGSGATIVGRTHFEVAEDAAARPWQLVGPYGSGGQLATTPADPNRLVVTSPGVAGLWISTDRARTWRYERLAAVSSGRTTVQLDPRRADRIWVAVTSRDDPTYQGRMLRSDDAGRTWRSLPFPDAQVAGFVVSPDGGVLVAATESTVEVSRDGGDTWTSTPAFWSGLLTGIAFAGDDLFLTSDDGVWRWSVATGAPALVRPAADFFATPRTVVVAGETVAVAQWDGSVWGSTDRGGTWRHLLDVEHLLSLTATGRTLLVDTNQENRISTDAGRTWRPAAKAGRAIVNSLAQWPDDDRTLLVGMETVGVFSTTDARRYTRIGTPGVPADELLVAGGKLLVGTPSDVYRAPLPVDPGRLDWGPTQGEGMIGFGVRGLVTDPRDPRTVWKLLQTGFFSIRLQRSLDGGSSYSDVFTDYASPLALLVHPADPRRLYLAYKDLTGAGLLTSRDGGATWRRINHLTEYAALAGDPRDPDRVWLGGEGGLWRSDDGGVNRVKVLDGPVSALSVDSRRIIVGGATIRVSTDGGRTFTEARSAGGRFTLPMRVSELVESRGVWYAGSADFAEAGLRFGGRGVLRSTDGGRTWSNIGAGLPDSSVRSLAVSPDGTWLYAGTAAGGVYRLALRR